MVVKYALYSSVSGGSYEHRVTSWLPKRLKVSQGGPCSMWLGWVGWLVGWL